MAEQEQEQQSLLRKEYLDLLNTSSANNYNKYDTINQSPQQQKGDVHANQNPNLGGKNIGLLYSYILHINNFIGPAMVMFPYVLY